MQSLVIRMFSLILNIAVVLLVIATVVAAGATIKANGFLAALVVLVGGLVGICLYAGLLYIVKGIYENTARTVELLEEQNRRS